MTDNPVVNDEETRRDPALPDNFKDVDALAASYRELQQKLHDRPSEEEVRGAFESAGMVDVPDNVAELARNVPRNQMDNLIEAVSVARVESEQQSAIMEFVKSDPELSEDLHYTKHMIDVFIKDHEGEDGIQDVLNTPAGLRMAFRESHRKQQHDDVPTGAGRPARMSTEDPNTLWRTIQEHGADTEKGRAARREFHKSTGVNLMEKWGQPDERDKW